MKVLSLPQHVYKSQLNVMYTVELKTHCCCNIHTLKNSLVREKNYTHIYRVRKVLSLPHCKEVTAPCNVHCRNGCS